MKYDSDRTVEISFYQTCIKCERNLFLEGLPCPHPEGALLLESTHSGKPGDP